MQGKIDKMQVGCAMSFIACVVFILCLNFVTVSGTDQLDYSGEMNSEEVVAEWRSLGAANRHEMVPGIVGEDVPISRRLQSKPILETSLLYGLKRGDVSSVLGQPARERGSSFSYQLAVLDKKSLGAAIFEYFVPGFSAYAHWFVIHFDDDDIAVRYEISD